MATSRFISLRWRMMALVMVILLVMAVACAWIARSTYLAVSQQQQSEALHQAHAQWQQQLQLQQRQIAVALQGALSTIEQDATTPTLSRIVSAQQLSIAFWQQDGRDLYLWPESHAWRQAWGAVSAALMQHGGVGIVAVDHMLWSCVQGPTANFAGCVRLDSLLAGTENNPFVHTSLWLKQGNVLKPLLDSKEVLDAAVLDRVVSTNLDMTQWVELPLLASEVQGYWRGVSQGEQVSAHTAQLLNKITTVFLLILMIAILLVIVHSRALIKPLMALQRFSRAVGRGESIKLHDKFRNDEIGQLYQQMFAMKHALIERLHHLQHQASHDGLTGLYNRLAATMQIETMLLTQPLFLLQFRIQSFKEINDSLGFASGDEILLQLARRMKEIGPTPVMAARLDSVEFLLAFAQVLDDSAVQQVLTSLSQNYTLVQSKLQLRLVAGCHFFDVGADLANGLRELSIATQHAQREGVALVQFSSDLDEAHNRQLAMIRDLPVTAATDEFFVLYQPVVRVKDGKCLGAEALIRWRHPRLGVISPTEFIPVAEYAGCIHVITQWMINTVSADLARWQRLGLPLKIGVNLSVQDVLDTDLPSRLHTTLAHYHVDPAQLVLEVREDVVMHMPERSMQTLKQLHQQGSLLTLDNFGKGQSSLAFLKTLPLQQLKIDRHFISNLCHDPKDQLIVRTTIELAHAMGQIVIAEGVEDEATLVLLKQLKCDLVQGYYYAKPLPTQEFIHWVQAHQQDPLQAGL